MHTIHTTTTTTASTAGASRRARPGLALLLALLSVPGSTFAWELPFGGFWIGLPLGVAAIVLATRARQEPSPPKKTAAAIVIAAVALLQMAVWTLVSLAS